jgi:membrane dipeptidase
VIVQTSIDARVTRLQAPGIVDLHFDLPMDLYEKRSRKNILATEFLPGLEAGNIGVLGAAVYIEDRYLPEMGLRVGLAQIARLYAEVDQSERFKLCKTYDEICRARQAGRIAILITMEGVEPFGGDLDQVRVFYELGVRAIGLTHARRNAAGDGGIFAASGSPRDGLTAFGRDVVRECEALGIMIDLAHINPSGFEEIIALTSKPPIISHTNARRYYDIERNISDEQIKMIGERGGVIGINAAIVSPHKEETTIDRYVDHIEHVTNLIGIDAVAIGFDFFEFIYRQWSEEVQRAFRAKFTDVHFIPELSNHSHARNVIRKLIERGFNDEEIEKILRKNCMRIFEELL